MTIVVGAISKPKGKRKPFFIIGSDTRGIDTEDGINMIYNDNQQKIYPFNTMYLGIAGSVPHDLFEDLSETIKDFELSFDLACEWLAREVKRYLDDYEFIEGQDYWRVRMILITIEENTPKMATFEYDTREMTEMSCEINMVEGNNHYVSFIGNTKFTQEQQLKLNKQFKHVLHVDKAKDIIEEFMLNTAKVYPEKVNTTFEFKHGIGDII